MPATNTTNSPMVDRGHQQTGAGGVPDDWDFPRIDAHASIKTGARNTQDREDDGKYPFFVRSQQVERINSYSYDGEAVLTAGDGVGTGKVFHYIDGRFDVHQRVYRITDFSDRLIGRYFYYQFSSRFYERIMSLTAKSSVDSVRMEMIAGMRIPLPHPSEQRAIAEALSDVDGLLGTLEALIAKKRAIKQAAAQQLLSGRTRLPGFSGEWERKRLVQVAEVNPESLPGSLSPDYKFNYISLEQVGAGHLLGYSEEVFATAPSRARRMLRPGDVLMSTVRPNLMGHLLFHGQIPRAICSTGFAVIRAKANLSVPGFLLAHLFAHEVNAQVEATLAGSNYPAISSRDVRSLEISCPVQIHEQTAIATVLSDMDTEIAALEQQRDKTRAIKLGMLQQLLTGRARLVEPAAVATTAPS